MALERVTLYGAGLVRPHYDDEITILCVSARLSDRQLIFDEENAFVEGRTHFTVSDIAKHGGYLYGKGFWATTEYGALIGLARVWTDDAERNNARANETTRRAKLVVAFVEAYTKKSP